MNNYQFPYPGGSTPQPSYNQFQQIQQMFPQPQGSVYSINNPIEIGNVPIGSTGLSVALCLSEGVMYIKSFQNGNPIIMTYRVTPFGKKDETPEVPAAVPSDAENTTERRLAALEEKLNKLSTPGGKFNDLL